MGSGHNRWLAALAMQAGLLACADAPEPAIFTLHEDTFAAADVEFTEEFRGIPMALGDVVGDDREDLVVGNRNGGLWVFENTGSLRFLDVTEALALPVRSGVVAVAIADMVGDERKELLVAIKDELFVLQASEPSEILARTPLSSLTEQLLPLDVDGDGTLELLVLQRTDEKNDSLFHIVDGAVVPVTINPLALSGRPWSATYWDANVDGIPDLHVANDTLAADFGDGEPIGANDEPRDAFFLGDPQTGFVEQPSAAGLGAPRSSMGGRVLDLGESRSLLYVPDLGLNHAFEWNGAGFDEVSGLGLDVAFYDREPCNSARRYECLVLSWSTVFADFDLDGAPELMVGNALSGPVFPTIFWYEWKSSQDRFRRRSGELGLEAQGLIASDLDRDGDIDLIIAGRDGRPVLAENTQTGVTCPRQLHLVGTRSNREGRGAQVTASYLEVPAQRHRVAIGGSAFVNEGVELHFGRCDLTRLDVLWPSGAQSAELAPAEGPIVLVEPDVDL